MKKLLIVVILEKIMQMILDKDSLSKSVEYIKHTDRSHILNKILRYLKYAIIIFVLSIIIISSAIIFGLYFLFTHF